jgi:UrcA family protein
MAKQTITALQHAAAIAVLSIGLVSTQRAHAAAPVDVPHRTIRYGDLDLSRDADARRLYSRIRGAARQVCPSVEERALAHRLQARDCIRAAISDAVHRVDAPLLTAIHERQELTAIHERQEMTPMAVAHR